MGNNPPKYDDLYPPNNNISDVKSQQQDCEISIIEQARLLKLKNNNEIIIQYNKDKNTYITQTKKSISNQINKMFNNLPKEIAKYIDSNDKFMFNCPIFLDGLLKYEDSFEHGLLVADNNNIIKTIYDHIVNEINNIVSNSKKYYGIIFTVTDINQFQKIYNISGQFIYVCVKSKIF